jgi:hypothetical protein
LLKTLKSWVSSILALSLVAGFIYLVYLSIQFMWISLQGLDGETSATIIATFGTVMAAVLTVVISQWWGRQRAIEESHRDKKVEIYSRFMDMMSRQLQYTKERKNNPTLPEQSEGYEEEYRGFTKDIIIWSGPELLLSWIKFKEVVDSDVVEGHFLLDDILREIREELAVSNDGLKRGDLIKFMLVDPESLDELIKGTTDKE